MSDAVNHPPHYGGDPAYEPVVVVEKWKLDFCLGNTVKYICRAGKKDQTKLLEDLKKAAWYLDFRIKSLEPAPVSTELYGACECQGQPTYILVERTLFCTNCKKSLNRDRI